MNHQTSAEMQSVRFFQRKRRQGGRNFSLEQIFDDVRRRIGDRVDVSVWIAPYTSNGLFRRLAIAIAAAFAQRDVNHITGDINFATIFMRRRRTVLTILDCAILERKSGIRRFVIWLFWFQIPVWRCRYVTVISSATKELLLREVYYSRDRIKVIPVAITKQFEKTPSDFDAENPHILQVGTGPNKNLVRLAQALQGTKCRLTVIGPLNDEQRRHLAENEICYENLTELSQAELVGCYQACDMLVFASTYEGFGMPILEANATGRPVVTSCVTSMPEVAGDAACLVDPFEVASIRTGIIKVIDDDEYRRTLVENGYRNVARFQAEEIASEYLKIYEAIAGVPRTQQSRPTTNLTKVDAADSQCE